MRRRLSDSVETPVASLIDVVFLLIIFFVVTASVEKDVIDESVKLAQAKYAKAIQKKHPQTIIINVRSDGKMNIAKMPISVNQLRRILIGARKDAGEHVPILIRADGNTRYEHLARVQEVAQNAGFYKIRLAAWTK